MFNRTLLFATTRHRTRNTSLNHRRRPARRLFKRHRSRNTHNSTTLVLFRFIINTRHKYNQLTVINRTVLFTSTGRTRNQRSSLHQLLQITTILARGRRRVSMVTQHRLTHHASRFIRNSNRNTLVTTSRPHRHTTHFRTIVTRPNTDLRIPPEHTTSNLVRHTGATNKDTTGFFSNRINNNRYNRKQRITHRRRSQLANLIFDTNSNFFRNNYNYQHSRKHHSQDQLATRRGSPVASGGHPRWGRTYRTCNSTAIRSNSPFPTTLASHVS